MKGQDQEIVRSREEILGFLLQEENLLYKFATEQIDSLQAHEMEQFDVQDEDQIVDYQMVLEEAKVDKPRVFFFVR